MTSLAAGAHSDFRLPFAQGLQPGDDVCQGTDLFLVRPVHQFNGARVKTRAGQLGKVTLPAETILQKFHAREVNARFPAALQNFPGAFDAERNPEFARKNVHRAERQNAEACARKTIRRVTKAVERFVYRAVAAGGDDQIESFTHGLRREPARVAGSRRGLQRAVRPDGVELTAKMPGLVAAGGWIKDDANAHALNDLRRTGG